jgi:hypothetical protein
MHEDHPFCADLSRAVIESLEGPYSQFNNRMFRTGQPFEDDYDELKLEYHRTGRQLSFLQWLSTKKDGVPHDTTPRFSRRKVFDMKLTRFTPEAQTFWIKSGQSFDKHHATKSTPKSRHTVDLDVSYDSIEKFLDKLSEPKASEYPKEIVEENDLEDPQITGIASVYA